MDFVSLRIANKINEIITERYSIESNIENVDF